MSSLAKGLWHDHTGEFCSGLRLQFSTPGIVGCQCSLPPLFAKEHAAPMIVDLILV
ncbi:hypothetical protein CC1G_09377 [Coprinopsis cinerea okayama7|uniref:Uncharacterized protein n=1 Tax=Coprinopsis cinerea (strain Okayama-7 / 130 / ATCC MYA-4618 / FGSC 9003) TaxID=240176 RepID=A8NB17_COPC7|nr:hypothetical protein CC1G_09377 [Coprinopsis cinerea okayama7\|eukprot:XP_001832019.2 hypothetical protein CC1G_09377 [Coprinopsis cinerea okayama7\